MYLKDVGEVEFFAEKLIRWTVPSYNIFKQKSDTPILSRLFYYKSVGLPSFKTLNISPFQIKNIPEGYFALIVTSNDYSESPVKYDVEFGIADIGNSIIGSSHGKWVEHRREFFVLKFVSIEALKVHKDLSSSEKPPFRLFFEVISKSKHCAVNASTIDKKKCASNPAVKTTESEEHEKQCSKQCSNKLHRSLEKLSKNLKDTYIQGQDTDLVLMVNDKKFKVHKVILRSRSPVFNAMFSHDFSEASSGIVPIDDCEPAVFEEFLLFVYSGSIQNLSSDNVCQLYYVADKYEVPELKEECVRFLKTSLSIETICDVICLSTKHNEAELLDLAIIFFARNMEEILITVKWQTFLRENPTESNELTIKALKLGFKKLEF